MLRTNAGIWLIECDSIRSHTEHGKYSGFETHYFRSQARATFDEIISCQHVSRCCRTRHNVRDAVTTLQQFTFFKRREYAICKTAVVQCAPKPVAGSGEMMT